jgi:hypothetical protein
MGCPTGSRWLCCRRPCIPQGCPPEQTLTQTACHLEPAACNLHAVEAPGIVIGVPGSAAASRAKGGFWSP